MSMTAPPTFRDVLFHLLAFSSADFSQRPSSEFPCGFGAAMLYGLVLRAMTDDGQNIHDTTKRERLLVGGRWLGLHDKEAWTTFDNKPTRPPNNGREVVSLFRKCIELDPLLLACFDPLAVHFVLKHDPLVGSFRCLVPLALPPVWLHDGHKPWARLIEVGDEMGQWMLTPAYSGEETERVKWRELLTAMFTKYEPKAEATP